jgi:transposase-like protein
MVLAGGFVMAPLVCKHCGSASFVRNGMAHGRQRYRCQACRRSFTATPPRGKPPAMKALAVLLYALGNVSQGMIAKLLGVSHVAVYKWVRAAGEDAPAPAARSVANIVQIDEMWHFVNGKKQGLALESL